ncbi:hypothetical protein VKT23_012883 [Stygiomarasmius scandens]|uniref:Uncharacterized protein n=1 Tax=Marasmiellus scandens TaxID=2682957 RepID=A0ABR1J5A5_9AGAR
MWYFEESNMQWDASRSGPIFSAPHQAESEGELPVTFFETGVFQLIAFNVRDAFIGQWQPFTTFDGITVIEAQTATTLNASPLPATVTTFLTLVTAQSLFSTITNNHENMQNSKLDTSKIAAGVAGGIVAFLLFTCVSVFLLCRKRRRSRDHYSRDTENNIEPFRLPPSFLIPARDSPVADPREARNCDDSQASIIGTSCPEFRTTSAVTCRNTQIPVPRQFTSEPGIFKKSSQVPRQLEGSVIGMEKVICTQAQAVRHGDSDSNYSLNDQESNKITELPPEYSFITN